MIIELSAGVEINISFSEPTVTESAYKMLFLNYTVTRR